MSRFRDIRLSRRASIVAAALVIAGLAAPGLAAQSVRLNGPLPQPGTGDVAESAITADSSRAVFRVAGIGVSQLFSSALGAGGGPALLDGPDVGTFQRTPGSRVVYSADPGTGSMELFSIPADGSTAPTPLSGDAVAGGNVVGFALGAERVVYRGDTLVDERYELFSVPVDGSEPPLQLVTDNPFGIDVLKFWVSPDGSLLAFSSPFLSLDQQRLHVMPVDGSQLWEIVADSGEPPEPGWFTVFREVKISPDDEFLVYSTLANFSDDEIPLELYAVPADASQPPSKLNLGPYDFYTGEPIFDVTPDASRIVYRETNGAIYSIAPDGTQRALLGNGLDFAIAPDGSHVVFHSANRLFSAPLDGSPAVELFGPGSSPYFYEISPDSTTVVYAVTDAGTSFRGLWAVPIDGGASTLLNGPMGASGRGVAPSGQALGISPDSSRVVFLDDRAADDVFELYSVPVDASAAAVRLHAPFDGSRDVVAYEIAPDGQSVTYLADEAFDQTFELFAVPIDGATGPVKCNGAMPPGPVVGDVLDFVATESGERVVYRADGDADEVFDLYSVRAAGGERVRLTGTLEAVGDVQPDYALGAGGEWVAFVAGGFGRLYSAPVDGSSSPIQLQSSGAVPPFAITPDESRVVYRWNPSGGNHRLFSAAIDGTSPPVLLHPLPGSNRAVDLFRLSPDGLTVVYRADHDLDEVDELYSVPVAGGAPPVKLNPPLGAQRNVTAFAIAPDGVRVLYLADQDTDGTVELYGVPLAGGSAVKLNGPLVAGGNVTGFQFTPDSQSVVYRADQVVNGSFELFGVAPDATVTRLAPLPVSASVETDFALASDHVLYRADALADGVIELFRVPVDGGSTPVRLSADMVTGGDVLSFAESPDGSRVLYRADQIQNGKNELFSVPSTGGPAVALAVLQPLGDVNSFQIDSTSSFAIYLADTITEGADELFRVPLDGSTPSERLNRTLPSGGDVEDDYVVLGGGDALYRADQETDGVMELFRKLHIAHHRRAASPTRTEEH